jgi:hypothetical protein
LDLIDAKHLAIYSSDIGLKEFIENFEGSDLITDFISLGINSKPDESISRVPSIQISGNITINKDYETVKNLIIKTTGLDNLSSTWICLPSGSTDFSVANIDSQYYSRNFARDEICQIYLVHDENKTFNIEYNTISFENATQSGYNYILVLKKPFGVNLQYDLEFKFETGKLIEPTIEPTITRTNNYTYSGNLEGDLIFSFTENE